MIKILFKDKNTARLEQIPQFRAGSWVHVERPTKEDIAWLIDNCGLDDGHLEDAQDPHEVPRVEKESEGLYVFSRMPMQEKGEVVTVPFVAVLTKDALITISQQANPFWTTFTGNIEINSTVKRVHLFLQIFVVINSSYQRFLIDINKKVRAITVNVEKVSNKDILEFVRYERSLNDFLAALVPAHAMLGSILSGKYFKLYAEDQEMMEDIVLSNGQMVELSKSNLKTIVNVRDAYSTLMTNNLNRVIKLLTGLTIVLTIPTMIASFFGMNVPLPIGGDNYAAFWIILAVATIISLSVFYLFIRKK